MTEEILREVELQATPARVESWQPVDKAPIAITLPATVYPPREDTNLLDKCVSELNFSTGAKLLEIGCGSGAVGIAAARRGWNVTACDINPLAVVATIGNAERAGVEIQTHEVGLSAVDSLPFTETFDAIIWNLPYLEPPEGKSPRLGPLEDAGLVDEQGIGWGERLRICLESQQHLLSENGIVLLIHNDNNRGKLLQSKWRVNGWATRVLGKTRLGGSELLTCFAAWRPWAGREFEFRETVDSTNTRLLEEAGDIGRCIFAAEQELGRGQRDRMWFTRDGDVAGSWLVDESVLTSNPGGAQIFSALAVVDTISCLLERPLVSSHWTNCADMTNLGIYLKWPNDIWLGKGKLAGCLHEGRQTGNQHRFVIGIGINNSSEAIEELPIAGLEKLGIHSQGKKLRPVLDASVASMFENHPRLPPTFNSSTIQSAWNLMSPFASIGTGLIYDGQNMRPVKLDATGSLKVSNSGENRIIEDAFERIWN